MAKSFTLIELVIVVTILAILAAVAIPVFANLQKQAKDAATKGALASMREAIQQYRMNEILNGRASGTGPFPGNGCPSASDVAPSEQMVTSAKVMAHGIVPDNPWAFSSVVIIIPGHENWVGGSSTWPPHTVVVIDYGWLYDAGNRCQIWANSAENDGTPSVDGENNCSTDPTTENCF